MKWVNSEWFKGLWHFCCVFCWCRSVSSRRTRKHSSDSFNIFHVMQTMNFTHLLRILLCEAMKRFEIQMIRSPHRRNKISVIVFVLTAWVARVAFVYTSWLNCANSKRHTLKDVAHNRPEQKQQVLLPTFFYQKFWVFPPMFPHANLQDVIIFIWSSAKQFSSLLWMNNISGRMIWGLSDPENIQHGYFQKFLTYVLDRTTACLNLKQPN